MRDIRANGVRDRWIARPAHSYADAATLRVSYATYAAWSGWLGHCHVPGQNTGDEGPTFGHWDPGAIDTAAFFAAAPHGAPAHQGAAHDGAAHPTYVVVDGDNLFQIALRFHTTVEKLVSLNHIKNPALIHPGDVLLLA
ncbi:LysM peptidoglycan-binding domain-containing protein [Phycicoccus sp. HDW14]|nr:LysM peptidoglycan-binding domain-containing protein [Phycicoccus sp. HDW14]